MANWKGTAVPNAGNLSSLYINKNATNEQMVKAFDSLTWKGEFIEPYVVVATEENGVDVPMFVILRNKVDETRFGYMLCYAGTSTDSILWFWAESAADSGFTEFGLRMMSMLGENCEFPLPTSIPLINQITLDGILCNVGAENDKLSSLFSITPFEEVQEAVTLDSWAEDIADAIREKKGIEKKEEWVGTEVPNSGTIENVYFNTDLSVDEVVSLLDTISTDNNGTYNVTMYNTDDGADGIIIIDAEKAYPNEGIKGYVIIAFGGTFVFISSQEVLEGIKQIDPSVSYDFVGWNPNTSNILEINSSSVGVISFGLENDKLSNLFSITPFEKKKAGLIPRLNFAQEIRSIEGGNDTSDATATASDILQGKTAYTANGKVEGTIEIYNGENEGGVVGSGSSSIEDIIEVSELPTPEFSGTAVPNSGTVEKLYINPNLSIYEVLAILKQLNYTVTPFTETPMNIVLASNDGTKILFITKEYDSESLSYYNFIMHDMTTDKTSLLGQLIYNANEESENVYGWNKEIYDIDKEVVNEYYGFSIGQENDKLSSLISISKFEFNIDTTKIYYVSSNQTFYKFEQGWVEYKYGGIVPTIEMYDEIQAPTTKVYDDISTWKSLEINVTVPDNYVITQGTKNITENGTVDVKEFEYAKVNVLVSKDFLSGSYSKISFPEGMTHATSYIFSGSGLRSFELPSSFTFIDEGLFYSNSALRSITIPNSVTTISRYAFKDCIGLQSVVIPDSVNKIGVEAFSGCERLTSVHIGSGLTTLEVEYQQGNKVFIGCSELSSITVDVNNTKYDSRNNCNAIIQTSFDKLIVGCKNTVIPDDVLTIGMNAFYSSNITSVTIPDSVTTIEGFAFYKCLNLNNVTFGSNLISIGESSFYNCYNITSIIIPDSVTEIKKHAFEMCQKIENVVLNNTITRINESTFDDCTSLQKITITDSVELIGISAFESCSSLKTVIIGTGLKVIETRAFWNCSNISHVYYKGTEEQWNKIYIGSGNDNLLNATIHFNYVEE